MTTITAPVSLFTPPINDDMTMHAFDFATFFPFFSLLANFFRQVTVSSLEVVPINVGDLTAAGTSIVTVWTNNKAPLPTFTGELMYEQMNQFSDSYTQLTNQAWPNLKPHLCSFTQNGHQVSPPSVLQGAPMLLVLQKRASNAGASQFRFRINFTVEVHGFRVLNSSPVLVIGPALAAMDAESRSQFSRELNGYLGVSSLSSDPYISPSFLASSLANMPQTNRDAFVLALAEKLESQEQVPIERHSHMASIRASPTPSLHASMAHAVPPPPGAHRLS